jgi:hypothetical protein
MMDEGQLMRDLKCKPVNECVGDDALIKIPESKQGPNAAWLHV